MDSNALKIMKTDQQCLLIAIMYLENDQTWKTTKNDEKRKIKASLLYIYRIAYVKNASHYSHYV